jgi:hypothetical protein
MSKPRSSGSVPDRDPRVRARPLRARRDRRPDDGSELTLEPGDLFHVPPGDDSWVVGDEPYVSLRFLGAESYAR